MIKNENPIESIDFVDLGTVQLPENLGGSQVLVQQVESNSTKAAYRYDLGTLSGQKGAIGFGQGIEYIQKIIANQDFYQLVGCNSVPKKFIIEPFQGGLKYCIIRLICETDDGDFDTVFHIPRGEKNQEEILMDYKNLSSLSDMAEFMLTDDAKEEFGINRPYGVVMADAGDSRQVPLMITPYLQDYWELSLVNSKEDKTIFAPIAPRTKEHEELQLLAGKRSVGNLTPEINQILEDQSFRVLRATILIWLLSERKFPSEFLVSAGDLMALTDSDGRKMRLMLTTVRGVLENKPQIQDLMSVLINQTETAIDPRQSGRIRTRLFSNIFRKYITAVALSHSNLEQTTEFPRIFSDAVRSAVSMIKPECLSQLYPEDELKGDLENSDRDLMGLTWNHQDCTS